MVERDQLARNAAQLVARRSYGKLIAFLAARTGDVATAEDALGEAFAAALRDWPIRGIPDRPEGWLLVIARRRLVDGSRRAATHSDAAGHLALLADERQGDETEEAIPDDRLRLMFACAHPAIDRQMRAPLILQTVLGFDAATIAGSFLMTPIAMGQRLVRAKTKIRNGGIAFRLPTLEDMPARLDAVLEAIYACYGQGWSHPSGMDSPRHRLAEEAIWLTKLVVSLLPNEPEALGLLALILHLEARRSARRGSDGEYVAFAEQHPSAWDEAMINEAEDILLGASHMGTIGRYQLEAAIQSAHVVRRVRGSPDWAVMEILYDHLLTLSASPVVAINRAVVIASYRSVEAGLAELDRLSGDTRLSQYQPFWAARAELLVRCGHRSAADIAYERAIDLEADPSVRRFLQDRRLRNSRYVPDRANGPDL